MARLYKAGLDATSFHDWLSYKYKTENQHRACKLVSMVRKMADSTEEKITSSKADLLIVYEELSGIVVTFDFAKLNWSHYLKKKVDYIGALATETKKGLLQWLSSSTASIAHIDQVCSGASACVNVAGDDDGDIDTDDAFGLNDVERVGEKRRLCEFKGSWHAKERMVFRVVFEAYIGYRICKPGRFGRPRFIDGYGFSIGLPGFCTY